MKHRLPVLACSALLLCAAVATAQAPASTRYRPSFDNVEISEVAKAVGDAIGYNIIIDPRVRGQVTLINPGGQSVNANQFYQMFLTMLKVYNFAALEAGNRTILIIQDVNVRTMSSPERAGGLPGGPDDFVTRNIEVKYVNPMQIQQVLRQLMPQNAVLQNVPGTNKLVAHDRRGNVERIEALIRDLDKESSAGGIEYVRLENATAADVVRTMSTLITTQPNEAAGGTAPKIIADERTNGILLSGDPTQRQRILAQIKMLDEPLAEGTGIRSIRLKYADAEEVATKLKEQVSGIVTAATAGAAGTPAAAAAAASNANVDRTVTIFADAGTNTLFFSAPPKVARQLQQVVEAIDIPRPQIHIEALIADVSTNKSADFGVNWAIFSNEDGTSVPAAGFISPVGTANNNPVSIVDLANTIANPGTTGTTIPTGATIGVGRLVDNGLNFAAMIRALQADTNSNVIANPTLTAMDNEEAEFTDALSVPLTSGQFTNTGGNNNGSVNPFTTINREDIGTKLKLTPQYNGDGLLTLTIELESSELTSAVGDAGSRITSKRSFKTTVLVEDGGTIVVGGMIRDSRRAGENRVPLLGSIPLVKEFFRTRNAQREKTNLMVFIRPRVITDSAQAAAVTNARYNATRDAQQSQQQKDRKELVPIMPDDAPLLPQLQQPAPAPLPSERAATP